jgi:hypothetical protein
MIRSYHFDAILMILLVNMGCLCSCYILAAHDSLNEVKMAIQDAEKTPALEEGQYHLAAAKRLLEAAEKEYEEADFVEARKLALEARRQVDLAKEISKTYSGENTH